eukprot:scaffold2782_cov328-Prasinococcus_capsulatus_cf.AAC.1
MELLGVPEALKGILRHPQWCAGGPASVGDPPCERAWGFVMASARISACAHLVPSLLAIVHGMRGRESVHGKAGHALRRHGAILSAYTAGVHKFSMSGTYVRARSHARAHVHTYTRTWRLCSSEESTRSNVHTCAHKHTYSRSGWGTRPGVADDARPTPVRARGSGGSAQSSLANSSATRPLCSLSACAGGHMPVHTYIFTRRKRARRTVRGRESRAASLRAPVVLRSTSDRDVGWVRVLSVTEERRGQQRMECGGGEGGGTSAAPSTYCQDALACCSALSMSRSFLGLVR